MPREALSRAGEVSLALTIPSAVALVVIPLPLVSTFPSVTNVSFTAMFEPFGIPRALGYEIQHFDRERIARLDLILALRIGDRRKEKRDNRENDADRRNKGRSRPNKHRGRDGGGDHDRGNETICTTIRQARHEASNNGDDDDGRGAGGVQFLVVAEPA